MFDTLILDTNVLLLLLVAQANPVIIRTFKRVSQFTRSDMQLLFDLLGRYRALSVTPHVLTETSNFVDQALITDRIQLIRVFQDFVQQNREIYVPSATLTQRPEFNDLGLSDVGLLAASLQATILTLDGKLYGRIIGQGGSAILFSNLRVRSLA